MGLSFDDEPNASGPQHDGFQGQGEVEDLTDENFADFDRDFTNDVERRAESLRVTVDHASADAHEVGSQPGSAFSPSSSEGDEDQDEDDNEFEQAEEWHHVDIHNPLPLPPAEPHPIHPAIRGKNDHNAIYRVDPLSGRLYPMHPDTNKDEFAFKAKMDQYSNRPSKRQKILTSSPVSPDYNTGMPDDIGVIPEPSPGAEEDDPAVSLCRKMKPQSRLLSRAVLPPNVLGPKRTKWTHHGSQVRLLMSRDLGEALQRASLRNCRNTILKM